MNILYNKKKNFKARFIEKMHKMIRDELIKNKANKERIDEFNKKIRTNDGKLNLFDLKKLNSVYKREYIGMVINDDNALCKYLDIINKKLTEAETEVVDL